MVVFLQTTAHKHKAKMKIEKVEVLETHLIHQLLHSHNKTLNSDDLQKCQTRILSYSILNVNNSQTIQTIVFSENSFFLEKPTSLFVFPHSYVYVDFGISLDIRSHAHTSIHTYQNIRQHTTTYDNIRMYNCRSVANYSNMLR